MLEKLLTDIDKIPGEEGWWTSSAGQSYRDAGELLLGRGLPPVMILELLSNLYWSAAECFGA